MQKRFDSNPGKCVFSAIRSKNTPTVSHQTIHLLCEKNEKIQNITIFPIVNRGSNGVLNKIKNYGKVKSHCLELIKIYYFPNLFQLSCEKTKKYRKS